MALSHSNIPSHANRFRSRSSFAPVAALAAVAAPSFLKAQIVTSGLLNSTVNSGTTSAPLDFNGNSTADAPEAYLSFSSDKGSDYINVYGVTGTKQDASIAFLFNNSPVAHGGTIGSNLSYSGEIASNFVPADDTNYYYAFAYQADGGPYYGWMELSRSTDGTSGTLVQWAYNSVSGASLTAGQLTAVPEPATAAALLGLAAAGAIWRRKRRQSDRRH